MPASQIFNCVHSCRQNGILEPYGGVKSTSRSGRFGKILAAQAQKSVGMDQDEVPFKLASRFSTGLRVWPIPLNGLIKEISGSQAEEKSEVKGFTSCSTHVSAHVQALFAPWLNILQLIVTALKVYDPHFGIYPSQKNGIWTTTQHKFVNAPQSRQFGTQQEITRSPMEIAALPIHFPPANRACWKIHEHFDDFPGNIGDFPARHVWLPKS